MEGAADECVGEDAVKGSGCFLGRPGLLLFLTAALSGAGTLFCCPRLLESPCKPAVIEIKSGREGGMEGEGVEGTGGVEGGWSMGWGVFKWRRGNETDVDQQSRRQEV